MPESERPPAGEAHLPDGFSHFLHRQLEQLALSISREHERLVLESRQDASRAGLECGAPSRGEPVLNRSSITAQPDVELGPCRDQVALASALSPMRERDRSAGAVSNALSATVGDPPARRHSIGSCSLLGADALQEPATAVPRSQCAPKPLTRECGRGTLKDIQEEDASTSWPSETPGALSSNTHHKRAPSSGRFVPDFFSCPDVGVYLQQGVDDGGPNSRCPLQSSLRRSFSVIVPTNTSAPGCSSTFRRRNMLQPRSQSANYTLGPATEQERTDSRLSGLQMPMPGAVEPLGCLMSTSYQDSVPLTHQRWRRATSEMSFKSILGSRVTSRQIEGGCHLTCKLLPAWVESTCVRPELSATSFVGSGSRRVNLTEESDANRLSKWVSRPNSRRRLTWDFCGVLFVLCECILAPLEFVATSVTDRVQSPVFEWFNRIFWTADMLASFLTGYSLANGSIEMRPSKTARRYVRTWLLPDALMVGADWMEVLVDQEAKVFRILGMMRIVRLLRLLRLQNTMSLFLEQLRSERAELLVGITRSVLAILGAAHFIACVWVGIGRASGPRGWVYVQPEQVASSNAELYVISLHWSLTNFAGAMELSPANAAERLFAMCTLFFGFVAASCFVSHITSNMTRLSIIVSQKATQIRMLNKYLRERSISIGLQHRVILNAHHVMSEQQQKTPEEHVGLLQHLSDHLRAELNYEIYKPVILSHPLMERLIDVNMRGTQQLCHSALSLVLVAEGDVVFSRGEAPEYPKMIFVESGVLAYSQNEDLDVEEDEEQVVAQQWLCEQVLWCDWVYHGTLFALELSRLVMLDAQKFRDVMRPSQSASRPLCKYAAEFVKSQNTGLTAQHRSDIGSKTECLRFVGISFPRPSVEGYSSPLAQLSAFLSVTSGSTLDKPQDVW